MMMTENPENVSAEKEIEFSSVLGKKGRQEILRILAKADMPLEIADLATELARREAVDKECDSVFDAAQQILIELHHCDLPKLADGSLVDYGVENRLVSVSERSEARARIEKSQWSAGHRVAQ
jgi:hypothetical protein